jgi:putative PIG3 family NAD(P)H quinone oxidoreductase
MTAAAMTAIEIREPGPPGVLQPVRVAVPSPGPGEVLIRVAAAGINRPDVLQRKGMYPPPQGVTSIPGLEVAGEIVELGPSAGGSSTAGSGRPRYAKGDEVCALVAGGGYAEFVAAPEVQCLPVPATVSLKEGAAIPETFFTVYYNLFQRAGLHAGETLLLHGGSGGIGTTAIMLAKAFDVRVIATAGSAEKCADCLALGADHAINYKNEDFVAATTTITQGKGADVILDMVGGDYLPRNVAAAAMEGRIALIATQGGTRSELDLRPLMMKRLTLTASTLRAQPVANKGRIADALRADVWPLFATKNLRPRIHARFPLAEAARAHELMESGSHFGKIILEA